MDTSDMGTTNCDAGTWIYGSFTTTPKRERKVREMYCYPDYGSRCQVLIKSSDPVNEMDLGNYQLNTECETVLGSGMGLLVDLVDKVLMGMLAGESVEVKAILKRIPGMSMETQAGAISAQPMDQGDDISGVVDKVNSKDHPREGADEDATVEQMEHDDGGDRSSDKFETLTFNIQLVSFEKAKVVVGVEKHAATILAQYHMEKGDEIFEDGGCSRGDLQDAACRYLRAIVILGLTAEEIFSDDGISEERAEKFRTLSLNYNGVLTSCFHKLGKVAIQHKKYPSAAFWCSQALRVKSKSDDCRLTRAEAWERLKEYAKAKEDLNTLKDTFTYVLRAKIESLETQLFKAEYEFNNPAVPPSDSGEKFNNLAVPVGDADEEMM